MTSIESTLSDVTTTDNTNINNNAAVNLSPIDSVGYAQTGYWIGFVLLLLAVVAPLFVQAIRAKVFSSSSSSSSSSSHQN